MKSILTEGMTFSGMFEYDSKTKSYHIIGGVTKADGYLISKSPELLIIAKAYRNLLKTMAHTEGEVATFRHIEDVLSEAEPK